MLSNHNPKAQKQLETYVAFFRVLFWFYRPALLETNTSTIRFTDLQSTTVLNIYPENFVANVNKRKLINFCLVQVKRVIALKWRDVQSPDSAQWLKEMSSHRALEKSTYTLKGKVAEFNDMWMPFLHLIDTLPNDFYEPRPVVNC